MSTGKPSDLLNNTKLIVINQTTKQKIEYRICEIEYYIRSNDHPDEYTHCNPDQLNFNCWYFHKTSKGNFKSGTFKGLDLCLGNKQKKEYYGILLRSIYSINDKRMICGPCNTVNEILKHMNCSTVSEFINKDTILNASKNNYFYLDREGLSLPREQLNYQLKIYLLVLELVYQINFRNGEIKNIDL